MSMKRIQAYLKADVAARLERYMTMRGVTRYRAVVDLIEKGLTNYERELHSVREEEELPVAVRRR